MDHLSNVIILVGAPRSGTSWIGKIFDSHPNVLYRHEPDLALYDGRLPFIILDKDTGNYVPITRELLQRFIRTPTLKSTGQLPHFPKAYYSRPVQAIHGSMIYALKWAEKFARYDLRGFPIPDLFDIDQCPYLRCVIKTVSAHGRMSVLLEAAPDARFIFLLRHPCGQVASLLRGHRQKKFASITSFDLSLLRTAPAQRYGLTESLVQSLSDVQKFTWNWVITNEIALDACGERSNCMLVIYENVCTDPMNEGQKIFQFCNLGWEQQTRRFVEASTSDQSPEKYYNVFRNPATASQKWRTELTVQQQQEILNIVRQTSLSSYWSDARIAPYESLFNGTNTNAYDMFGYEKLYPERRELLQLMKRDLNDADIAVRAGHVRAAEYYLTRASRRITDSGVEL